MKLFTEDLISSIKRAILVPTSQSTYQDADFIAVLNEEQETTLTPLLLSVREDFFLTFKTTALAANQYAYPVPPRAIGNALKDIWYLDGSGNRNSTLARTSVHNLSTSQLQGNIPGEFILQGDSVRVFPTPSANSGSLQMWHFQRPNELTATGSCAAITAVSADVAGITTLTVDTDLTSSLPIGSRMDIVSGTSPYLLHAMDAVITNITNSTIEVATTSLQNEASATVAAVGDYICPAGKTNIPQYPDELHPVLAVASACYILHALGDANKAMLMEQKKEKLIKNVLNLVINRVESEPETIVSNSGILGMSSFSGRRPASV